LRKTVSKTALSAVALAVPAGGAATVWALARPAHARSATAAANFSNDLISQFIGTPTALVKCPPAD
jgi:hypothetical protein